MDAWKLSRIIGVPVDLRMRLTRSCQILGKAHGIFQEYVVGLYYPAQRLSRWQRIRCSPLLFLVEYLVYRVDTVAEDSRSADLDAADNEDYDKLLRYKQLFEALLRRMHAHNAAVSRQLRMGEQYVRLENKVTSLGAASHEQAVKLAELRPSDVRLLHAMTFALLGKPVDYDLLELLWPVEVLADIGNDLSHYSADVTAGHYNTYDAFVRLYGHAAPDRLRAEIMRYEESFRAKLGRFPAEQRDHLAGICVRRYQSRTAHIPQPQLYDSKRTAQAGRAP